jgi:class 3 adenylate cyclase
MAQVEVDRVERRLSAILAADVVGYSRLMGADEEGTLTRLKEHRRSLIDPKITEHRGRIVKTTGDGLLVEFASVVDAVRCAVEVQRGMAELNAELAPEQRMDFRMGINVGDIIIDGNDIYGDGVNVAARLETLAEPGGICVSRTVRDQVRDKLDFGFTDMGSKSVKNIVRPVRVHKVVISTNASIGVGNVVRAPAAAFLKLPPFARRALRQSGNLAWRALKLILVLVIVGIVAYRWIMPPTTPTMLAAMATSGNLNQHSVPFAAISPELTHALVAGEDGRFCQHTGVSWGSAPDTGGGRPGLLGNVESIDMLVAQSLFMWPGDDLLVRVLEIPLAYAIDLIWPKRRIAEVYLNTARWGTNVFGADAAARAYFGKSAAQLSRREAALLVAVLPDPLQASPARPTPYVTGRANKIASNMEAARFDYSCLR